MFNKDEIIKIIWKQLEKDVSQGEHASGSGHLSHVDCKINNISEPEKVSEGWEITYRYTVYTTTEFTIYPDNPPWETEYERTIVINKKGEFVKSRNLSNLSSMLDPVQPIDSSVDEKNSINIDEELVQRVVDLKIGEDITGEYITQRLKELEILADEIIQQAARTVEVDPESQGEIYESTYWEIHEKLGSGSIGPATAVASGLMAEKKEELAKLLGINRDDRI